MTTMLTQGVNDENFYNFKSINQTIIQRINNTRRTLNHYFNEYKNKIVTDQSHKESFPTHEAAVNNLREFTNKSKDIATSISITSSKIENTKESLSDIKKIINSSNFSNSNRIEVDRLLYQLESYLFQTENSIKEANNYLNEIDQQKLQLHVIEDDYRMLQNQMEEITELAGLGLVAETLTHELYTLINNLKKNTEEISKYVKENFLNDNRMERFFNYVKYSSDALRKQVSHLSPGFKSVRAKKELTSLRKLLETHIEYYKDRAKRKNIKLTLIGNNDYMINVNNGMINQVLDNIYLNSEHWLVHDLGYKRIDFGEFNLEIKGDGFLDIWDNGNGIDNSLGNKIFEPFITNKENGRGLGLYIVTRILNQYKCKIRLLREKNIYGNLYKFEIDFNNCK
jgi:signal transduction histidine kinase